MSVIHFTLHYNDADIRALKDHDYMYINLEDLHEALPGLDITLGEVTHLINGGNINQYRAEDFHKYLYADRFAVYEIMEMNEDFVDVLSFLKWFQNIVEQIDFNDDLDEEISELSMVNDSLQHELHDARKEIERLRTIIAAYNINMN